MGEMKIIGRNGRGFSPGGAASAVRVAALFLLVGAAQQIGAQQKGWPRKGGGEQDRIQASPVLADLTDDGNLEVLVPSFDDKLYAYNHDGTPLSGWPQTLGFGDGTIGSVAVGDVTGNGQPNIVVLGDGLLGRSASVRVYAANGSLVASHALNNNTNASGKSTPALIDVKRYSGSTPHPAQEILVRDGDGQVHILVWNGSGFDDLYDNNSSLFKTCTDDIQKDRFASQPITPSISAVSLGNDKTYLVAPSTDNRVYHWEITSTATTNWSVTQKTTLHVNVPQAIKFLSSAALADLNGDGNLEIVVGGNDGNVYVWKGDGSGDYLGGWPVQTGQAITSSPAIADVSGDGNLEIVIGSNDGKVYVWNRWGSLLNGWPRETHGPIFGSPVVGDLDAQPGLEIVASSLDGWLYAWTSDGTALPGWPKRMNSPLYSSPAIGDMHRGGRRSIVVGSYYGRVFCLDLAMRYVAGDSEWLQFRGGKNRTGNGE